MTQRLLDPTQGEKPLDFGAGGVTGSIDRNGHLIALNTYHPTYGYSTLTAAGAFSDALRYEPIAVRAYRAELATLSGFGPTCTHDSTQRRAYLLEDVIPYMEFTLGDQGIVRCTTFAAYGGVFQHWTFEHVARPITWYGRLSFQRCAYTQLTEGGPMPTPPVVADVALYDGILTIENIHLGQTVAIFGLWNSAEHWEAHDEGQIDLRFETDVDQISLIFAFADDPRVARQRVRDLAHHELSAVLQEQRNLWQKRWQHIPDNMLIRRGLAYGTMMAVPVDGTTCLLTDHMLLPLAWNRDAYYLARAFLQWQQPEATELVRQHLLWTFEIAERMDGWWGRAYLANGRIKDRGFQLDQQIFPLLELAEYVLSTGDKATLYRLTPQVNATLQLLSGLATDGVGLYPTSETPADDPIAMPYHLSSHILLWHTLQKLSKLPLQTTISLQDMETTVRRAIDTYFIATHHDEKLYAYATDGDGHHQFYHDANDTPTVMAAEWAMVDKQDPIWVDTMRFAFSERNKGGYYDKRLGSVHTPAPWPLGDIQALQIARTQHDETAIASIEALLERVAQWDGALPEAYDSTSFAVISRHWFAWPNALLATLYLPPLSEQELKP